MEELKGAALLVRGSARDMSDPNHLTCDDRAPTQEELAGRGKMPSEVRTLPTSHVWRSRSEAWIAC